MFRYLVRLLGLVVLTASVGFLSAPVASTEASSGPGTIFLTLNRPAPDGAIVTPMDLQLGLFYTIASGFTYPHGIKCGYDGRLYFVEHSRIFPSIGERILRINQDGRGLTVVEASPLLAVQSLLPARDGDLFFSTRSWAAGGEPSQGIWRIPGAQKSDQEFNPPHQILPPDAFGPPPSDTYSFAHLGSVLSGGSFAGDLLIADNSTGHGGRVLRASQPEFTSTKEFIPAHLDPETGQVFIPRATATSSEGDVLVADANNDKILRYGFDGTFKDLFARVPIPASIDIGPDGTVYVTTYNGPTIGRLFIFDPQGNQIGPPAASAPQGFTGVTVCAPH